MDRHRFDVGPDPGPTFYFDADPDPAPTLSYTHVGKSEFFLLFTRTAVPVYIVFFFLLSVIGVIIFSVLDRIFEFVGKKIVYLYIYLEKDADADPD
jgi:hypothetical protein